MRFLLLAFLIIVTSCNQSGKSEEMTTYYFIRHAEKDMTDPKNEDPELTAEGRARVEKWVEVFKEVPLDHVYSSDWKRTRQTAQPIADHHNLPVLMYNTEELNDEDFQENTKGKTVLVVGHRNLNPEFVNYIIEEEKYEDIPESESGSLFVVTVTPSGEKNSHVLHIN